MSAEDDDEDELGTSMVVQLTADPPAEDLALASTRAEKLAVFQAFYAEKLKKLARIVLAYTGATVKELPAMGSMIINAPREVITELSRPDGVLGGSEYRIIPNGYVEQID